MAKVCERTIQAGRRLGGQAVRVCGFASRRGQGPLPEAGSGEGDGLLTGLLSLGHTRARRVQNMGWTPDNKLWLATRGGDVFFGDASTEKFDQAKLGSRGFGILDVGSVPLVTNMVEYCVMRTVQEGGGGQESDRRQPIVSEKMM